MEQKIEYKDFGDAKYIGEVITELPENCIFDKVTTGCGATTVAINSEIPTIIAVPFVNLVKSKMDWIGNPEKNEKGIKMFPVHKGVYASHVKQALKQGYTKIMTVYDSLPKVTEALGERLKDFNLVIDEAHILTNAGSYREIAIYKLIEDYKKYRSYTFITATPPNYFPIDGLKIVQAKWNNLYKSYIKINKVEDPKKVLLDKLNIALFCRYKNTQYRTAKENEAPFDNMHIFYNSVVGIITMVKSILKYFKENSTFGKEVNNEEFIRKYFRVIIADTKTNKSKLKAEDIGLEVGKIEEKPKAINFYTSTAYEGIDINDENGKSYIVVEGENDISKLDIFTTIPQIVGRIRDQRGGNNTEVIMSIDTRKHLNDKAGYFNAIDDATTQAKSMLKELRNLTEEESIENHRKLLRTKRYIIEPSLNNFVLNEPYIAYERERYERIVELYSNPESFAENDRIRVSFVDRHFQNLRTNHLMKNHHILDNDPEAFERSCIAFINYKKRGDEDLTDEEKEHCEEIGYIFPDIKEVFDKLGAKGFEKQNYRKSIFRAKVIELDSRLEEAQKLLSHMSLPLNAFIRTDEVDRKYKKACLELNIPERQKYIEPLISIGYKESEPIRKRRKDMNGWYFYLETPIINLRD